MTEDLIDDICMRPAYWRGFSKDNLLRGLAASLVVSTLISALDFFGVIELIPRHAIGFTLSRYKAWSYGVVVLFLLFTAFHAATHSCFALLHDHGERAFEANDFARALRFLRPFAWGGNDHYDESGDAHRMLLACLIHLRRDKDAARVAKRCEKLGFETDLEAKD